MTGSILDAAEGPLYVVLASSVSRLSESEVEAGSEMREEKNNFFGIKLHLERPCP
jgi:hypothetical protein